MSPGVSLGLPSVGLFLDLSSHSQRLKRLTVKQVYRHSSVECRSIATEALAVPGSLVGPPSLFEAFEVFDYKRLITSRSHKPITWTINAHSRCQSQCIDLQHPHLIPPEDQVIEVCSLQIYSFLHIASKLWRSNPLKRSNWKGSSKASVALSLLLGCSACYVKSIAVPWIPCIRVVRDSTLMGLSASQMAHSRHLVTNDPRRL